MELKHIVVPFSMKATGDDGTVEGYGSVFNVLDSYDEIVVPGAFSESLAEHKKAGTMPKMLWQHRTDQIPGKWDAMAEDKHGLFTKGHMILGTQLGKEAHVLLKENALDGLSIGFVTREDSWDEKTGIRSLKRVDLWEVSLVTFPANPAAMITGVKAIKTIREFEDFLRDAGGYSRNQAKAIAASGFKAVTETRDEGEALAAVAAAIKRNISIINPS